MGIWDAYVVKFETNGDAVQPPYNPDFVAFDDHSITVSPTGIDDTANVQFALIEAAKEGYPTVKLNSGTYFISSVYVENFKGTLEGVTKAQTIVEVLDNSINCAGMELAEKTSSAIKFVGGEPRIRYMTIKTGWPCENSQPIQSVLHFTGASAMSGNCANDLIFGAVDRVILQGSRNTFDGISSAVLVSAEGNQLGGCKQTLLGTFKLNRSEISSFWIGLSTTMKSASQVDVNFNLFEVNGNAIWLSDTNQNTTITGNVISAVDVSDWWQKGVVIRTETLDAPHKTRVVINNNEFTLLSSAGVTNYAVDVTQSGRVANVSAVITNNKFYLSGGNARGISMSDVSNTHVSANRFTGDGEMAVYVSGTTPVSSWTITANKGLADFVSSEGADIKLDADTSECIIGSGQGADVNDLGTDNTVLPQS